MGEMSSKLIQTKEPTIIDDAIDKVGNKIDKFIKKVKNATDDDDNNGEESFIFKQSVTSKGNAMHDCLHACSH